MVLSSLHVLAALTGVSMALAPTTWTRRSAMAAGVALPGLAGASTGGARSHLESSRKTLGRILDDFETIVSGGGDALRRELGFVGTSSALVNIDKSLMAVADDVDDPVAFGELQEDFLLALRAADADAYSANFVTFSSAKGTPAGYFKSAKSEVVRALADLDGVLSLLETR